MVPKFFTRKIEPAKGCCCFSSGVKRALKFREGFKLGIKKIKIKKRKEKEREVTMKKKKNLSLPSHAVTFLLLLAPRLYATFIHMACSQRDSRWVQEKRLRLLPKQKSRSKDLSQWSSHTSHHFGENYPFSFYLITPWLNANPQRRCKELSYD